MLWLALHLSALPLEAWLAASPPEVAERPCCVVEARRVIHANAAAQAAGVQVGMSAASALSTTLNMRVFTRDIDIEISQIHRLALSLSRFTPSIVLQPAQQPHTVLLEVAASLRLFGGQRALWRAVSAEAKHGCVQSLSMKAASTATAAAVLAHAEPASPALRRLPVAQRLDALPLADAARAWGIEPRLVDLLHGVGCRTLGDVRMLPRRGAQRRGAAALLDAIERAHGTAPDPQTWFELPRSFEQGLELAQRADDAAMLVFAAQRLVQPLAGWLAQQWLAAARLSLVLRHETSLRHAQPDTVITLALANPTRDAAQITLLLRERLQRIALPAPVYALRLRLDQAASHAGRAPGLWAGASSGERGAGDEDARALFDRLAARLGPERVRRPVLVADHRPEHAMVFVPLHAADRAGISARAEHAPNEEALSRSGTMRPTWLLPAPQPLLQDPAFGRPLYQGRPLALASRAERIEAGWFDGAPVSRDYHVAQAHDRRWLWVFRERRGAQSQWYLHGIFG